MNANVSYDTGRDPKSGVTFCWENQSCVSKGTARSADLRPTQYSAIMRKWFSLVTLLGLI